MDQSRAINALEPFLALSKSATSPRAAIDVITQATSHPNTYVFAELLQTPNIATLRNSSEHASYYRLLEIFTWGTWSDYQATSTLPKLSPQQHEKLLLLSLLPLARHQSNLTYNKLQSSLSIPSSSDLESLITKAIYAGLITGTLDPHNQTVNITSIAPLRDLAPGSVSAYTKALSEWSLRCTETLKALEMQVAQTMERARVEGERKERLDGLVEVKMAEEEKKGKKGGIAMGDVMDEGFEDGDAMDVDSGGGRTRGSKKGWMQNKLGRLVQ